MLDYPNVPEKCPYEVAGDSPPHRIITLPLDVVSEGFKHMDLPVVLCAFCDGSTHEAAIKAHDKRS
jgi:hypothetical protein